MGKGVSSQISPRYNEMWKKSVPSNVSESGSLSQRSAHNEKKAAPLAAIVTEPMNFEFIENGK